MEMLGKIRRMHVRDKMSVRTTLPAYNFEALDFLKSRIS